MFSLQKVRYMQYCAAFSATLSMTAGGTYMAWSSPMLPLLRSEDSPIGVTLTSEEGSWLVSIYLLASVPICVIMPYLVDKFGRRGTLLMSTLFYLLPWFLIIFANATWMLFAARCIGGIGLGIATTSVSIYNGEIADKDIRGKLGTTFNFMKLMGSCIILTIGPFVSYTTLAIIAATVPVLFFCTFYFMPESPYHLVRIGKTEEARHALARLSSNNASSGYITKKLMDIEETIANDDKNQMGMMDFFTRKEFRRLIIIIVGVKTLQQMSGSWAMEAYLQTIIEASGSAITPEVSSIIAGTVQIPAMLLTAVTVDRWGRRPILITSAFGCTVTLLLEGIYFYLQDSTDVDTAFLSWLPTTALAIFLLMSNFGILCLPYVLLGECFPTNVKGVAVTAASFYGAVLAFTSSKIFTPVSEAWGTCSIFFLFAIVCGSGTVFVYFMLPETMGKTFMEIQDIVNGKKKQDLEAFNAEKKSTKF